MDSEPKISGLNVSSAVQEVSLTEMEKALTQNQDSISSLSFAVELLVKKLEPVIAPEPEKESKIGDTDTSYMTMRARNIEEKTLQIRNVEKVVNYLVRNLQV